MSIAIVVLTHDRLHLLCRCVENVLSRTSAATQEIVIWNNGSSDGTAEYLDSLTDPRVRVVHHPTNIGQSAYADAFPLTSSDFLVDLDDDVIAAPDEWDRMLLDAFRRLPEVGFLAADLEENEHDPASITRHQVRPHLYIPFELNGVRLLEGPAGGGCAMTSREIYERAGGMKKQKNQVFFLEDQAYIESVRRLGYRAAVLPDLRVFHAGGPYYSQQPAEKLEYWAREQRLQGRKDAVKRALLRLPFVRRLNRRFMWFFEPETG
jgi:GT2 family glycosyltransferase